MPFKFGVCVNPVDTPEDFVSLVRQTDEGGFDYFWLADIALLARDIVPYLTLAATNSRHVQVGPAVFHPFARHPGYSANTMATLDLISGGRAVYGMGMGGGEIVGELGLPPARRDRILEAAARTLGATPIRAFAYVVLPLAWPGIAAGAVLAFMTSFDDVIMPLFLGGIGAGTVPKVMLDSLYTISDPSVMAVSASISAVGLTLLVLALTLRGRRGG